MNEKFPPWLGCPLCQGPLQHRNGGAYCPKDGLTFPVEDGIWRMIPPDQQAAADAYAERYRTRRESQGWGRLEALQMAALPDISPPGWDKIYWPVRRQSYRALTSWLKKFGDSYDRPLRVVDMGAGVGWLASRLAVLGHDLVALDINCDDAFGLQAADRLRRELSADMSLVQGDIEKPPFQQASVDLLIYNASLHYASDVKGCLAHAATILQEGGGLVIMDSPISRGPVTAVYEASPGDETSGDNNANRRLGRHLPRVEVTEALSEAGFSYDISRVRRGLRWQLRQWRTRLFGVAVFDLPLVTARLS